MNRFSILATIVLVDAVDISIGGFILRYVALVPLALTVLTYVAVVILLAVSYFLFRSRVLAIKIGVILSVVAMVISTNSAHIIALTEFGTTIPLTAADVTMLIGFYILPVTYIAYWFFRMRSSGPKQDSITS